MEVEQASEGARSPVPLRAKFPFPPHVAHVFSPPPRAAALLLPVRLLSGGSNLSRLNSHNPPTSRRPPPPFGSLDSPPCPPPPPSHRRAWSGDRRRALLAGSGLPLPPPRASDDDLRAALAGGALLAAALRRLGPAASAPDEGGASAGSAAEAASDDVGRFLAAVERMGLPTFAASDLDRGPMSAVVVCLLALRDRFGSHVGEVLHCTLEEIGRMPSMEFAIRENGHGTQNSGFIKESKEVKRNLQKVSKSPGPSEPSSPMSRPELCSISRHAGHNFHEVFHLRQGVYSDMPTSKILEMMKSTNLDNAPTQSLLSFVNGILDEIIENKNGEIPYVGYSKAMHTSLAC